MLNVMNNLFRLFRKKQIRIYHESIDEKSADVSHLNNLSIFQAICYLVKWWITNDVDATNDFMIEFSGRNSNGFFRNEK